MGCRLRSSRVTVRRALALAVGTALVVSCGSRGAGREALAIGGPTREVVTDATVADGDAPQADVRALARGITSFALRLHQQLAAANPDGNLVAGPYSAATALLMAYAGTSGRTAAELEAALDIDLPPERVAAAWAALDAEVARRTNSGVQIDVANRTLVRPDITVLPAYAAELAGPFRAPVTQADLGDPATLDAINDWVRRSTKDRIPTLFDQLSPNAVFVLLNAMALDATWAQKLEARPQVSFVTGGTTEQVPGMGATLSAAATAQGAYRAVELPYRGDDLSMVVIEPDDLAAFEAELTPDRLDVILRQLLGADVTLTMPTWTLATAADLIPPLQALGVTSLFERDGADLSRMLDTGSPPVFVSQVRHRAMIEVDERGTKAAAATGVEGEQVSAGPLPLAIEIDHPFVYLVRDRVTGTVLFLGRVVDPAAG